MPELSLKEKDRRWSLPGNKTEFVTAFFCHIYKEVTNYGEPDKLL